MAEQRAQRVDRPDHQEERRSHAADDPPEGRPNGRSRDGDPPGDHAGDGGRRSHGTRQRRVTALGASRRAVEAVQSMTDRQIEGVVGVERQDDGGWFVVLEVLETARVPNTSDVLAEYEARLAPDGTLQSYRRRSRYTRGSSGGGEDR